MLRKYTLTFPLVFEIFIWVFYVSFYKYSYHIKLAKLPHIPNSNFPYIQLGLFSMCITLYLIPYYRWAVPRLLYLRRYAWLVVLTIVYFVFVTPFNNLAVARIFDLFTNEMTVNRYFSSLSHSYHTDWDMMMTDMLAFFCIAFSRFSYQNEVKRHEIEKDHLNLQLSMLKNQLQPHFLFNTLNSLYGMSLTGSKETSRFILLLSQMMQYILYDCDKERVDLEEEITFMQGYFELEQKKFPMSQISMTTPGLLPQIKIPPLLFLPLVENSFKHGRHKLENNAGVSAKLSIAGKSLVFYIENDLLPEGTLIASKARGGIGLNNIKARLELYYKGRYELLLEKEFGKFKARLRLDIL